MTESSPDPYELIFRPTALASGMTDKQLRHAANKTEELARLGPGVSFQSAAAMHRLALLDADFTYVRFTANRGSGNRRHLRHTHRVRSRTSK